MKMKNGKLLELVKANLLKSGGSVYLGDDKSNKGTVTRTGCIRFSKQVYASPTAFARAVSIKQNRTINGNTPSGWGRIKYKNHFLLHWRGKLDEMQKVSANEEEAAEISKDSGSRAQKRKADFDEGKVTQTKRGRKLMQMATNDEQQPAQMEGMDDADSGSSDSLRETAADEAGQSQEEVALIEQLATYKSKLADAEQNLQATNLKLRQVEDEQRAQGESHRDILAHYAISCFDLHNELVAQEVRMAKQDRRIGKRDQDIAEKYHVIGSLQTEVIELKKDFLKQAEKTHTWEKQYNQCNERLNDMYELIDGKEGEIADLKDEVADLKKEVTRLETRAHSGDLLASFSGRDLHSIDEEVYKYFIERYDSAAADILETNPHIHEDDWKALSGLLEHDRFEKAASAREAFKAVCMMHPDKTQDAPTLERARLTAHFRILEPIIKAAKNMGR